MTATMLQPVGGMDAIPRAFARALGSIVRFGSEIVSIKRAGTGARVSWKERGREQVQTMETDFVVCTIPLPPLSRIDTDFPGPVRRAIRVGASAYVSAVKVAFESSRRWWESDLGIYGGISWTSRDINQIWYPSSGFNHKKGILVGAYIWTPQVARRFAAMRPARRVATVRDGVDQLHPGYGRQIDRGVAVAWSKLPFAGGAWVDRGNEEWQAAYPVLRRPVGPVYFAGEHMSMLNQWQEGAVRSAQEVVTAIAAEAGRPR
jgi:monoamine oxidase